MVSVLVVFARNQLLNTDAYVSTVAPLATNPAVQTQVATRVSEELVARTDLSQRVKGALPSKAGFLVTPIADGVQSATYSVTLKLVQSPQFEQLWVAANRASHKQLVAVLTGTSTGSVSTKGGKITIDLSQVELTAKKDLDAKAITVFDKVPAVKGLNYVLFQSNDLVRIQGLVNFLNKLAVVLPIVTLLFFAGVVVAHPQPAPGPGPGRRRAGPVHGPDPGAHRRGPQPVPRPGPPAPVARGHRRGHRHGHRQPAGGASGSSWRWPPSSPSAGCWPATPGAGQVGNLRKPGWVTGGPVHGFVAPPPPGPAMGGPGPRPPDPGHLERPHRSVAVIVVAVTLVVVGLLGVFAGAGRRPARAARRRPDPTAAPRRTLRPTTPLPGPQEWRAPTTPQGATADPGGRAARVPPTQAPGPARRLCRVGGRDLGRGISPRRRGRRTGRR